MVSISEFLSGISYGGQPVVGGNLDPMAGHGGSESAFSKPQLKQMAKEQVMSGMTPGQPVMNLDAQIDKAYQGLLQEHGYSDAFGIPGLKESDFEYNIAPLYANLLQGAAADGGILSSQQQDRRFAGITAGAGQQLGRLGRERGRGAAAANLNPIFAEQQSIEDEYGALSGLIGQRNQLAAQREEDIFGAQQAFTNMMASTSIAEKQFKVNTAASIHGANIGAEAAIKGGEAAASGSKFAGLATGIGMAIGGGIF